MEQLRKDLEYSSQEKVKQAVAEIERSCETALQEKQEQLYRETELRKQALTEVSALQQKQLDSMQNQRAVQDSKSIDQNQPQQVSGPGSQPQDQNVQLKETPQSDRSVPESRPQDQNAQLTLQSDRYQPQDVPQGQRLQVQDERSNAGERFGAGCAVRTAVARER